MHDNRGSSIRWRLCHVVVVDLRVALLSPATIVAGVLLLLTVVVYAVWWRRMFRGGRWIVPPAIGLAGLCGIGLLQSRWRTEVVLGPGLPLWAAAGAMLVTAGLMVWFLRNVAGVALADVDWAAVSRRVELAAVQVCSIGDELD